MIAFFVPGRPRSTQTGSVVRVNGRAFPVRRNTAWAAVCGLWARHVAPPSLLTGAVRVRLTFLLPAPKRWRGGTLPIGRPDLENLAKGLLDSWNGVLYRDDSQVAELVVAKRYSLQTPGVRVEVEAVSAAESDREAARC